MPTPQLYMYHLYNVTGATIQTLPEGKPTGRLLDEAQVKLTQEIKGIFLYYARSVNPMMFPVVKNLATRQAGADASILWLLIVYSNMYPDG